MQDQERNAKLNKGLVGLAGEKNYPKILEHVQKVEITANDKTRLANLLNFKDDSGKTLIHHIIENPKCGYRPGIWAMIELHIKGASPNIADNLGNTVLHSCATLYKGFMQAQIRSEGLTVFASTLNIGLAKEVDCVSRPADEQIMFALMSDVGAMLYCGANPGLKNQKGETVFELMASVAAMLKPESAKPNICEACCKKAFTMFFENDKHFFGESKYTSSVVYPWAPNVVKWAEALHIDDSVKNASLVAVQTQTQTQTPSTSSSGCMLF